MEATEINEVELWELIKRDVRATILLDSCDKSEYYVMNYVVGRGSE
jgi:hypothetical protein